IAAQVDQQDGASEVGQLRGFDQVLVVVGHGGGSSIGGGDSLTQQVVDDLLITEVPGAAYPALAHGAEDGALGFVEMAAVAEFTAPQKRPELGETPGDLFPLQMPQTKLADSRGVDQAAAGGQQIVAGGGGGVVALGDLRQIPGDGLRAGIDAVEQGGLADTRLAHQDRGLSPQALPQVLQAQGLGGGNLDHSVFQLAVQGQELFDTAVAVVQQIQLVENQQGFDAQLFRRHQVAVDQVLMGLGLWSKNNAHLGDVGRHRAQHTPVVGAGHQAGSGQHRLDHPGGFASAPDHLVAGKHIMDTGA